MASGFRLMVLAKIRELEEANPVRLVTPTQLTEALGKNPANVRMLLVRLLRAGLVERPWRGGYRLSEEGRRLLEEAASGEGRD